VIDTQTATDIRDRYNAFQTWLGDRCSYRPEDVPPNVPRVTNEEVSALEVWQFINEPANTWSMYLASDGRTLTTWPGDKLATVTSETVREVGFGYRPSRTYLRAIAIDGSHWYGTSPGRGMYARMRRARR
jgi:hypothetical protein